MTKPEEHTNKKTIIVLPESDEDTLCLRVTGIIKKDDFQSELMDNLSRIIEKNGWYNLVAIFDDEHKGWEEDAASLSMQSIIDLGKYSRKLAYINLPEQRMMMQKAMPQLYSGEIRYFDNYEDAVKWVKN